MTGEHTSDHLPKSISDLIQHDGVFVDGNWVETKDQDPQGDVRLIQLADVGDGVYRNRSARFLTSPKARELNCTFLKPGDLLIARMPDPLGRACIFPGDAKPSVTVVDVCIVRTGTDGTNHRWLMHRINSTEIRNEIAGLQSGSTRKRISRSNLARISFLVPPLDEQQRIVAEIEKQFTRLDAGVASLKRGQTALKRYRASVLKAACEGRLTNGAKEHPTLPDALLDVAESNDAIANTKENLPSLPASWRWVQVGKVFQTRQGVQIPKSEQRTVACPGFKRYLYISDFKRSESLKFVEDKFPGQEVTERDLVMANTGSPGEVFRGTNGILSNNLFRISFDAQHFAQRFVYYYFKSPLFLSRIKLKGGAQQHVGHRTIAAHLMPLPPLAQQRRIVAEVGRRLSVVEVLEAGVNANLQRAARFRQSILSHAFIGKLARARD